MKVCLLAPEFLPNWGGVGTYTTELAKEISKHVDLTVFTLSRTLGNRTYGKEEMEAALGGRAKIEVISRARDTFAYNARFQLAVLRKLRRLVATEHPDIIHSQHAHMPDLLYRQANWSATGITTIHTTIRGQLDSIRLSLRFGGKLEPSERWQVALNPLLRTAERLTLRPNRRYITVSRWMQDRLAEQGIPASQVSVVFNGVDPTRFTPAAREGLSGPAESGGLRILFPGRPTLVKGVGVWARAIPLILKETRDVQFYFTGGEEPQFARLIPRGGAVRFRVKFLGYVEYDDLPGVYASMDIGVVPTFYENVPLRVLELMSSGVATVASKVGGLPEIIDTGRNGVLVSPGSHEELAEAVVRLAQDEPLRRSVANQARQTVATRFSWAKTGAETLKSYNDVIGWAS
jgi:glycosyltransferase involved in cell wall biosynthesis